MLRLARRTHAAVQRHGAAMQGAMQRVQTTTGIGTNSALVCAAAAASAWRPAASASAAPLCTLHRPLPLGVARASYLGRPSRISAAVSVAAAAAASAAAPVRCFKEFANAKLGSKERRHSRGVVIIPEYVTADHLAHLLKRTMRQLAKDGARTFDWWPVQTERNMKKESYSTAKDIILHFDDSAKLARLYRRVPLLRDLSDDEWAKSRPYGPPLMMQRPAVIAIMGHKDHGKTTLLDKLRGGNVAGKEEFGITQETYAFNVDVDPPADVPLGNLLTIPASASQSATGLTGSGGGSDVRVPFSFLDTPGHVSFSEMRHNVGSICDAILLVVAADEGVLDQTFESLRLARNLARPLIVVINKMDLPGAEAKAKRIRQELQDLGAKVHPAHAPVVSNKGDLVVVELSALKDGEADGGAQRGSSKGFYELKQALLLVSQQLPLTYDANAPPRGIVVESMVEPGRGPVVRVNLTQGTLARGDHFLAEAVFDGRVKDIRAMAGAAKPILELGQVLSRHSGDAKEGRGSASNMSMESVGAGYTVDVTGCIALPNPGAEFVVCSSMEQAKLAALVGRNRIKYADQERVVPEREAEEAEEEAAEEAEEQQRQVSTRPSKRVSRAQVHDVAEEAEFDEVEEVDEEGQDADEMAAPLYEDAEQEYDEEEVMDEEEGVEEDEEEGAISADEVPVDLDPRGRVAPPLPPRSQWELAPPPPPTQRAMPLSNLRPQFKFYTLDADASPQAEESATRNASVTVQQVQDEGGKRKFGLTVLIKTQNMGALQMLRASIEEMNAVNAARGLPEIHVAYAAAGDLTKKDLVNAEAEGCWVYGFRIARPNKQLIAQARTRPVPLFAFRHHQHLLDHLQHHIEQSPTLTKSGEAKLDQPFTTKRRSHPTVQ